MGDSLAQSNTKLGCNGVWKSDTVVANGVTQSNYLWGELTKTNSVSANFQNNRMTGKTFVPERQPESSCFPTGTALNQIKTGLNRGEVEQIIGCKGQTGNSLSVSDNTIQTSYNWGTASKQFLVLNFDNNRLTGISYNSSNQNSSCEPSQSAWSNIRIGDNYQTAMTKIGCEGILLNITDVGNTPKLTYHWGNLINQNYVQLGFSNGQVTTKSFKPKSGSVSSCTPTTEQWMNVNLGSDYNTARSQLGCEGVLQGAVAVSNSESKLTYNWGHVGSQFTLFSFDNGSLSTKSYNNSTQRSNCEPTQQQFNQVQIGQSISQATSYFSCTGAMNSMTQVSANVITRSYSWGQITNTNFALINTDNDIVTAKSFHPK
ncbi:hypothetical protein FPV60_00760 [Acinetobacter colistiniresistens]|uniref:Uncharacterized protein n=5 Tax=Acinetobacter colistiniresistens TaxID=280145 RepID=A0A558FQ69_9GAMM|nr:hypothetical protein FPV60_00760 [Acinetobacter colistiniresistens]